MKTLILAFSLLVASATAFASASYPELAQSSMQKAWKGFEKDASVLNKSGVLPHETKDLRKRIGALREVMDLFVYSYWNTSKQDPWMQIRDFLDEGYELIGSYKDLYDIQGLESPEAAEYDATEIQPIRREIQTWWQRWNYSAKDVYTYLMNPSANTIYERNKSDLSRFYWGASDLVPQLNQTADQNLIALCQDLLQTALNDWPTVKKIKSPSDSLKKEHQFHDFRKRLRSVARILRAFDGLYNGSEENLLRLEDLSTRYGAINDKITTAHRAEKRGQDKKVEKLHKQIEQDWQNLVEYQKDQDLKGLLQATLESLK